MTVGVGIFNIFVGSQALRKGRVDNAAVVTAHKQRHDAQKQTYFRPFLATHSRGHFQPRAMESNLEKKALQLEHRIDALDKKLEDDCRDGKAEGSGSVESLGQQ